MDNNSKNYKKEFQLSMYKEFWANGGYMNPALIGWNDHFQNFNFTDGRHRLVAAYQLGERWAPVLVDKDSVEKVKDLIQVKETR